MNLWHEYTHIMTDPAHSLVEFTFVLFDVLVIDAVRRQWNRRLHREHARIDAEHGVTHPEG